MQEEIKTPSFTHGNVGQLRCRVQLVQYWPNTWSEFQVSHLGRLWWFGFAKVVGTVCDLSKVSPLDLQKVIPLQP